MKRSSKFQLIEVALKGYLATKGSLLKYGMEEIEKAQEWSD